MSSSSLPPGWAQTKLGDCASKVTKGSTPTSYGHSYQADGIPFVRIENIKRGRIDRSSISVFIDDAANETLKRSQLEEGDLLMSIAGTIGRSALVREEDVPANTNQALAIIRGTGTVFDPDFLRFSLASDGVQSQAKKEQRGGALQNISLKDVKGFEIPVPPLNEQRRIVAKIEELTARSRAAKQALDAIPPLLERFRQSVLAAAFRGDLTKQWRAQNPNTEPASELLKRIRQERRQRWEQDYLQTQKAKGKQPKNDKWKDKYQEPEPVDTTDLPELPEGWCWASLPEMGEVSRGKSKHRPRNDPSLYSEEGMPFIQTGEVANSGGCITGATKFYSKKGVAQSRVFPKGTVCITIAANIANSAILEMEACFPDSVVGVVCTDGLVCSEYLEYFIRTARASLEMYAPATAQKNINLAILSQVAVPIPPVEEREMIVRTLDEAFERIRRLDTAEEAVTTQLTRLNQSILAKAFRGELVPQDPNDEPASVMLDRIRAQSDAAESKVKAGARRSG